MRLNFDASGHSWIGGYRSNNEDSYLVSSSVVAVADGVGGQAGGEIASATVIGALADAAAERGGQPFSDEEVIEVLAEAHLRIAQRAGGDEFVQRMATTLTALFRTKHDLILGHIGDSRAYLLRNGELQQVSHDDSFIQQLLDSGAITAEESSHHPLRSVIIKTLNGDTPSVDSTVGLSHHELKDRDRWLLTSDGLTDYVPIEQVAETLSAAQPPEAVAASLISLAEQCSSGDNTTVVVCDMQRTTTTHDAQVGGATAELPDADTP